MKQTVFALALCALLAWTVWRQPPPQPTVQHREFFALGTLVQISFAETVPAELISQVQQRLNAFEQRWSTQSDGELAQLNQQLAEHAQAPLPQALRHGFELALSACKNSGGLFDPAMGGLVKLWGFDDEQHFRSEPPSPIEIQSTLAQTSSFCAAELDESIRLPKPGAQLDFGASAKGRAVDEIVAFLQQAGVANAIVNAGGDLKALGSRPDRPWRIGIRAPRPESGQDILASVEVKNGEAVFSSGDYERFFIYQGRRYHHIIDPRDGSPSQLSQSATVIHTQAELADAAATALFVAGPELAAERMQSMGIELYMLVAADGSLHLSPAMRERVQLQQ